MKRLFALSLAIVTYFLILVAPVNAGWEKEDAIFDAVQSIQIQVYHVTTNQQQVAVGSPLTIYDKVNPITTKLVRGQDETGVEEVFIPVGAAEAYPGGPEEDTLAPIGIFDEFVQYRVTVTIDKSALNGIPGGFNPDDSSDGIYLRYDPPGPLGGVCLPKTNRNDCAVEYLSGYRGEVFAQRDPDRDGIYTFEFPLDNDGKNGLFYKNEGLDFEIGICQQTGCNAFGSGRKVEKYGSNNIKFPESVYPTEPIVGRTMHACKIEYATLAVGETGGVIFRSLESEGITNATDICIIVHNLDLGLGSAQLSVDRWDFPIYTLNHDSDGNGSLDGYHACGEVNEYKNLSAGTYQVEVTANNFSLCKRELPVSVVGEPTIPLPNTVAPEVLPTVMPGANTGSSDLPFLPANTVKLCDTISDPELNSACNKCPEGTVWTSIGCLPTDASGLIKAIFTTLGGIMGAFILLCIVINGLKVMTSQGNPEELKKAQEGITSCIVGFIVLLFAVLIIRIIGADILDLPWFGTTPTPSG